MLTVTFGISKTGAFGSIYEYSSSPASRSCEIEMLIEPLPLRKDDSKTFIVIAVAGGLNNMIRVITDPRSNRDFDSRDVVKRCS